MGCAASTPRVQVKPAPAGPALPPIVLTDKQKQSFTRPKRSKRLSEAYVATEDGTSASAAEDYFFDPNWIGIQTRHGIDYYKLPSQGGFAKINQDRGMVCWPFNGSFGSALLCLFDGHGEGGERIAEFCCETLPSLLEGDPMLPTNPEEALIRNVVKLDEMVLSGGLSEVIQYCGTTLTVVYLSGSTARVACAGDSRCVHGQTSKMGQVTASDMSVDHKPSLPGELERLTEAGATVDENKRLWIQCDGMLCGLAMSRSIGDGVCKRFGVIPDPQVQKHSLASAGGKQFVIVASDGVWDQISSEAACEIVAQKPTALEACKALVDGSVDQWKATSMCYRDDITAIVVFIPFLHADWDERAGELVDAAQSVVNSTNPATAKHQINMGSAGIERIAEDDLPAELKELMKQPEALWPKPLASSFKKKSVAPTDL